jgi:glycosyltransferase involved in cell wall biosynthesis
MAKRLNEKKIPFIWQAFTNEPLKDNIDGLIRREVTFNIDSYIKDSDFLIQLSNCESWGYSTAQAFELGVPVIATDYPAIFEQGMEVGKNGFVLKMDMSNLDEVIDNMYNNNLKGFKYNKKDNKQQWIDELGKMNKKDNYIPEEIKGTEVQVIKPCFYSKENQQCEKGDTLIIETEERLNDLINRGYVKLI